MKTFEKSNVDLFNYFAIDILERLYGNCSPKQYDISRVELTLKKFFKMQTHKTIKLLLEHKRI